MDDEDEDEDEEEEVELDAVAVELEDGGREEERRGAEWEAEARVDGSPACARACTKEGH